MILRSLTLLRQLSLHAGLIDDAYLELPCSKIDMLIEQLRDVAGGGHRALVFSQFTRFLGKVRGTAGRRRDRVLLPGRQDPRPGRRGAAVQGGHRPGVPDQPQGRGVRAEPHRGRLLLPARPVVEPGHRDAGSGPDAPHWADPQGHGVPADRGGHHRGKGHGAARRERRSCSPACWTVATSSAPASTPTTSAPCSTSLRPAGSGRGYFLGSCAGWRLIRPSIWSRRSRSSSSRWRRPRR